MKKKINKKYLIELFKKVNICISSNELDFLFELDKKHQALSFSELLKNCIDKYFILKYKTLRKKLQIKNPNVVIPIDFCELIIKMCEMEIESENKILEKKKEKISNSNIRFNLFSEESIRKKVFREFTNKNNSILSIRNNNKPFIDFNDCGFSIIDEDGQLNDEGKQALISRNILKYGTVKSNKELFNFSFPKNNQKLSSNNNLIRIYTTDHEIKENINIKPFKIYPNGESNYQEIINFHEKTLNSTKKKLKNIVNELNEKDTIRNKNLKKLNLVKSLESIYSNHPLLCKNYIFFDTIDQKFKTIEEEKNKSKNKCNLFEEYSKNKKRKKKIDEIINKEIHKNKVELNYLLFKNKIKNKILENSFKKKFSDTSRDNPLASRGDYIKKKMDYLTTRERYYYKTLNMKKNL